MADFGYFQAEANKNGLVLCMICFKGKPRDQMVPVEGEPGKVWDICKKCRPKAFEEA